MHFLQYYYQLNNDELPFQVRHEVLQSFSVRGRQQGQSLAESFQLFLGVCELWAERERNTAVKIK